MKIRHALLCLALLFVLGSPLAFAVATPVSVTNASDDILAADIPIRYGDEAFRKRILERTGGKRSPVGLVLSGGSARAFAHIGVLKYLEEQGIVPDFIVSNSMGSIVGLLYAAGMSPDQILALMTGTSLQSLFDITFPVEGGILNPSRFTAKLASILGKDLKVEDLKIPIIVVTEDLVTERQVQISEGDFYDVLQAAYALPAYFPPVDYRGHLLMDGGVTNLAPVNLAYTYADSVIVSTTFYDVDTLNLRNPLTVLNVTLDIGKRRQGVRELKHSPDNLVWIRCNVEKFSFMDFSSVSQITKRGYDSARSVHDELAALPTTLPVSSMADIRAEFDAKIPREMERYKLYSHTRQRAPSFVFGLGAKSWRQDDVDRTYLKDDNAVGLDYILRFGDFDLNVNGGMAFNAYVDDSFSFNPALNVDLSYYFLKYLRASVAMNAVWDHAMNDPVFQLREMLDGKVFLYDDVLRLQFHQGLETVFHTEDSGSSLEFWPNATVLLDIGMTGSYHPKPSGTWIVSDADLGFDYQVLGNYDVSRQFLAPHIHLGLENTKTGIFVTLASTLRFALDGKDNVPYFLSDGFRTNDASIRSQGHDVSSSTNDSNYLATASLYIGYRPIDFKPSFGELFLFERSSIALYCDSLWYDEQADLPTFSMGLEFHTDLSLLGIKTLPLTVYAGWDQAVSSYIWGFWFNVTV